MDYCTDNVVMPWKHSYGSFELGIIYHINPKVRHKEHEFCIISNRCTNKVSC